MFQRIALRQNNVILSRVSWRLLSGTDSQLCQYEEFYERLVYSDKIETTKTAKRGNLYHIRQEQVRLQREIERERLSNELVIDKGNMPIALQFMYKNTGQVQGESSDNSIETIDVLPPSLEDPEPPSKTQKSPRAVYPFNIFHTIGESQDKETPVKSGLGRRGRRKVEMIPDKKVENTTPDFDVITNELNPEEAREFLSEDELFKYGTADPAVKSSNVPCGGCGALLHCRDTKLPGFVPSELFRGQKIEELRTLICQRCYFIKEYDIALKVSVSPEDYPKTIRHIKDKRATVVVMVDLLDYPGSVWPDLFNVVGTDKHFILVGNKVDMLPQDSPHYLKNIERSMRKSFVRKCSQSGIEVSDKILDSALISARTGYNVEKVIDLIYKTWEDHRSQSNGDVYLIGTTNVGKSSLFNLLLESDLCKFQASDEVEKAMTSPVPGTTLNLLRFPIMRPSPSRMNQRRRRLKRDMAVQNKHEKERIELLRQYKKREYGIPSAPVGQTFIYKSDKNIPLKGTAFQLNPKEAPVTKRPPRLDPSHQDYSGGKWCFDTPGTVSEDQIINLLTQEEITAVLPELPIRPRTFLIKVGQSIFVAGLGRIDITDGPETFHPLRITVFCSDDLPINIVETVEAENFYSDALGTDLFKVPNGDAGRLNEFPALEGQDFTIDSLSLHESSCDIVLSSVGWVSFTPKLGQLYKVKAFTPGGRGLAIRDPAFLPFAVLLRGHRIPGSPTYRNDRVYIPSVL